MKKFLKRLQQVTIFPKKADTRAQIDFLKAIGQMLDKGFSLKEALEYVQILEQDKPGYASLVMEDLKMGRDFHTSLQHLGFPKHLTSQIHLSEGHGRLSHSLLLTSEQLQNEQKKKKELLALLQYPLFMMIFLIGMIFAIRSILLPQLLAMNGGQVEMNLPLLFVSYFPHLLLVLFFMGIVLFFTVRAHLSKLKPIQRLQFLSQIPLYGSYYQLLLTYRVTQEWALMFESGLMMKDIVYLMQVSSASNEMQTIGAAMEAGYLEGRSTVEILAELNLFAPDTVYVIQHGERISSMSEELAYFSQLIFDRLSEKLARLFQLVQPLLFIFIAVLIVTIFVAMMSPMISLMDQISL